MGALTIKSDVLLLLTAVIWGFAFVAQRAGMDYIGPFAFNGIRFALGCLVLLPLVLQDLRQRKEINAAPDSANHNHFIWGSILSGLFLFGGASLQQVGLVYTTAGNAGFITGLYVVIVPIIGIFIGHKTNFGIWLGAGLAAIGLYFLSISGALTIAVGDLLVLIGAFVWAIHVLVIAWFSPRTSALRLAFAQFAICSLLSLSAALIWETMDAAAVWKAAIPLAYGGFLSVGVAYTLQVVAQKSAHPAHAAILLSLEAVFAAIGGRVLLNEAMTLRSLLGCTLMLTGMLASQLWGIWRWSARRLFESSV